MNETIKSAEKNLKIAVLLTFISINLNYVVGNFMKPLFLLDIVKPIGHHAHHYEIHVPNLPDICGDIVTVIILAFAYLFLTSSPVKRLWQIISEKEGSDSYLASSIQSVRWSRSVFLITSIGFALYFLSKYYLSLGLEVFGEEEEEGSLIVHAFAFFNYWIVLCSAFILVYAYCKYANPNKAVSFFLYVFFLIRSLFATNMLGLVTHYDIFVGSTAVDMFVPAILGYSIFCILFNLKNGACRLSLAEPDATIALQGNEIPETSANIG